MIPTTTINTTPTPTAQRVRETSAGQLPSLAVQSGKVRHQGVASSAMVRVSCKFQPARPSALICSGRGRADRSTRKRN